MPVYDQNTTALRVGIVIAVDTAKGSMDLRLEDTESLYTAVPFGNPYTSKGGHAALSVVPRVGDRFVLGLTPSVGEVAVLASLPYANVNTSEADNPETLESRPRDSFLGDRANLPQGSINLQSDKDCFVRVLPGGNIEIHVDEFCLSEMCRDSRTLHTFCENLISEGFWGSSEFFTLREDARDEADRTPTGYSLHQKSYVQDAPHVFLDAGAVLDDEQLLLPGYPVLSGRAFGKGICLRFMVLDQDKANNQQMTGGKPDPRTASVLVRIDQAGNAYVKFAGAFSGFYRSRTTQVEEREVIQAGSISARTTSGDFSVEAAGECALSSRLGIRLETKGRLTLKASNIVFDGGAEDRVFRGGWSARVKGNWAVKVSGSGNISVDRGLTLRSGGSRSDYVGGRYSLRVASKDAPENTGRDILAYKVQVDQGKLALRATQGSVEISVGPSALPIASIRIHSDLTRDPLRAGSVEIITASGAKLSLDATGAFRLGGEAGQIVGDAAGGIQLGPPLGAPSYILTSETRCYVTGLPFIGNPHLTATRVLPPIPSPVAAPVVGVVPPALPAPLPDDVEFVS